MPSLSRDLSSNALRLLLACVSMAALGLSGCSANFGAVATSGIEIPGQPGVALTGKLHGGQSAISGATVQMFSAGTSGYNTPAALVATATNPTDSNGGFSFASGYTCPSNGDIYIVASGGNPGLGTGNSNSSITLLTAVGTCAQLAATSFIQVNEVTTVAAIWALQQFASTTCTATVCIPMSSSTPTTVPDNISSDSGNILGLQNAFQTALVLANPATGYSPGSDMGGPGFVSGTGNQGNVEYWQVDELADILAACVNTNGATTSTPTPAACYTLYNYATSNGVPGAAGGVAPMDTFQAALYMARNPISNISNLASLVTSSAPFQPADTATPNDFTIGLTYKTGTSDSRWIAFDSYGDAWISTGGAGVIEMDPVGNIIPTPTSYTPTGGTSTNIATSYEVAVDTNNNAWFTDENNYNIFEIKGSTQAGAASKGAGTAVSTAAGAALTGIAIDGSNNVFASATGKYIYEVASGATSSTTGAALTSNPYGIAVDMSNIAKFGNKTLSNGGSFVYALDSGGCGTNITVNGTTGHGGGSIAMAYAVGNGSTIASASTTPLSYIVDVACNNTTNVANTTNNIGGTGTTTARVMMSTPYGIAFDNSNNMWIVNQNYTSTSDASSGSFSLSKVAAQDYGLYSAFTGSVAAANYTFTNISGIAGGLNTPYYLAMDGASAAWVANANGAQVSAFTNAGVNISPATGFSGGVSSTLARSPGAGTRGIAVDGSGNVWVANTSGTYVNVLVGVATPTVTPLSLGIANGTLASRP